MRIAALILALAVTPLWAHHGSAGFDKDKPVHFTGKVSQLDWANPHIVIHLDVSGADGYVMTWLVSTWPPNVALRRGFSKSSLAPGTEITVDGYQGTGNSNRVNGTNIVLPDGRKMVSPDCFNRAAGQICYQPSGGAGHPIPTVP